MVHSMIREADKTYPDIAAALGISTRTLARRVNGHLPITFEELSEIAEACGYSLSEAVSRIERIRERRAAS